MLHDMTMVCDSLLCDQSDWPLVEPQNEWLAILDCGCHFPITTCAQWDNGWNPESPFRSLLPRYQWWTKCCQIDFRAWVMASLRPCCHVAEDSEGWVFYLKSSCTISQNEFLRRSEPISLWYVMVLLLHRGSAMRSLPEGPCQCLCHQRKPQQIAKRKESQFVVVREYLLGLDATKEPVGEFPAPSHVLQNEHKKPWATDPWKVLVCNYTFLTIQHLVKYFWILVSLRGTEALSNACTVEGNGAPVELFEIFMPQKSCRQHMILRATVVNCHHEFETKWGDTTLHFPHGEMSIDYGDSEGRKCIALAKLWN